MDTNIYNNLKRRSKSAQSKGLAFTLNADSQSYAVTGIGTCLDTEVLIPDVYKSLPVTSISSEAFKDNTSITAISIPASIIQIDQKAFYGCTSLIAVLISEGVRAIDAEAFAGCVRLATVHITDLGKWCTIEFTTPASNPLIFAHELYINGSDKVSELVTSDTITSISKYAFYNYAGLSSAVISDNISSIGESAFAGCINLSDITISDNVVSIGVNAFYQTAYFENAANWNSGLLYLGKHLISAGSGVSTCVVADSVKSIADSAFQACTNLTAIQLPNSLLHIGKDAFSQCFKLQSIALPENLLSIGARAFYCCDALSSIVIPNSVVGIGEYAFYACVNLANINLGIGVTSVGKNTFSHCIKLESITVPDSVVDLGPGAFYNCTNLRSVIIGNSVRSLGKLCFYNCYKLESITIGNSVEDIGENAFDSCAELSEIVLPDNVRNIGDLALSNCIKLANVTIGRNVSSIGINVFNDCRNLKWIQVEANNQWYMQVNGDLYSKDQDILIQYAIGKSATQFIIPAGVTDILSSALQKANNLITIELARTVNNIGIDAFSTCSMLREIKVPSSNLAYKDIDGVLFSSDLKTLIQQPIGSIKSTLILPSSVICIAESALKNCGNIKSIYYEGSKESWVNVDIKDNNDIIHAVPRYYYTNTAPAEPGSFWRYVGGIPIPWDADLNISAGLAFEYLGDDTCAVKGIGTCTDSYIRIPETSPEGYRVKTIADYAFEGNRNITGVAIPEGVEVIGNRAFSECTKLNTISLPETLTKIFANAFFKCTSLTSIVLPDSVTEIEDYVFHSCSNLASIKLSHNLKNISYQAFCQCSSLGYIDIPEGVNKISMEAFYGCTTLTGIDLPSSLRNIEGYAFGGCKALKSIVIPEGVTDINSYVFVDNTQLAAVNLPTSLRNIGDHCFSGCTSIINLDIPEGIIHIGTKAFKGCTALTSIRIPDSIERIDSGLLNGCSALASLDLPFVGNEAASLENTAESVFGYIFGDEAYTGGVATSQTYHTLQSVTYYIPASLRAVSVRGGKINFGAFYGCSQLTSITLDDSISTIGNYAFYGCSSLSQMVLPNTVAAIGQYAFYGCSSLSLINIPSLVTTIAASTFYNCTSLLSITFSDSITGVGSYAFYGCSALRTINFGSNISTIDTYAFASCKALTDVIIPSSVTSIDGYAFSGCSSLVAVYLPATYPSLVNSTAFSSNASGRKFWVDTNAIKNTYIGLTEWSDLKSAFYINATETFVFNANGGSGSMANQQIKGSGTLNAVTFGIPATGYYFVGWNTKADGTGTAYSNKAQVTIVSDGTTTLYAQWSDVYEVKFYKGYNSNTSSYLTWIGGGASSNTGKQELYGCQISYDGGATYQTLDTSYYRGYFTGGKNTHVNTLKVRYGTKLRVWVMDDHSYDCTYCTITRQDGQVIAAHNPSYDFPVQANTKIKFSWATTGYAWSTGTSCWDCEVSSY